MLTSSVPAFMMQPEAWAVPYSTAVKAQQNEEI